MSNGTVQQLKSVDSKCFPLKTLFSEKFTVDFYQREYVWEKKQLEDLINDLSNAFLKCWDSGHTLENVRTYDPYFMGEVVLSIKPNDRSAIIDGQQRITTFTLLLIYMLQTYKNVASFPSSDIEKAIYDNDYGTPRFNLDIDVRRPCMMALFTNGNYDPTDADRMHVQKIVDRYNDISDCWNERIDQNNISSFAYWILNKIMFSKVWANSDDFAYVIFETMNDRGLPLTHVEMLRSYLLANINASYRDSALQKFDSTIEKLSAVKLPSKSKAEMEFFKIFLRGHYAQDLSQGKDTSDFVRIGNAFHRWVRENEKLLQLNKSSDFIDFVDKIEFFAKQYILIQKYISERKNQQHFYLLVNSDYGFTLQPALILAAIAYNDSPDIVEQKIELISKYLTKVLSWRVWNHWMISQSSLEAPIYDLCKAIRNSDLETLAQVVSSNPIELPSLSTPPILNQQNRKKLKVLLALITEIVARESGESHYLLNEPDMEVEHIWSDHYEEHTSEFKQLNEFVTARNTIGDLLILPKSFNASYGDAPYETKVVQYFAQNILAQSLNSSKYKNNPGFEKFISSSGLKFESYDHFLKAQIDQRSDLYKSILLWNWQEL